MLLTEVTPPGPKAVQCYWNLLLHPGRGADLAGLADHVDVAVAGAAEALRVAGLGQGRGVVAGLVLEHVVEVVVRDGLQLDLRGDCESGRQQRAQERKRWRRRQEAGGGGGSGLSSWGERHPGVSVNWRWLAFRGGGKLASVGARARTGAGRHEDLHDRGVAGGRHDREAACAGARPGCERRHGWSLARAGHGTM